jgi:hypothetical protein
VTRDPNDLQALDAYVAGDLDDAEAFEDALFALAADGRAEAAAYTDRVARQSAHLLERRTFHPGGTRADVAELRAQGLNVLEIELGLPGERHVELALAPDTDLVVTVLDLGRRDLSVVDTEMEVPGGGMTKIVRDVRVDEDGRLYGMCERELAELGYRTGHAITRVVAVRDGRREVVATWDIRATLI